MRKICPVRRKASTTARPSAIVRGMGFSHQTSLPASAAADGPQDGPRIAEMGPAHAADADDRLGQRVARGEIALASQNMAGDDSQRGGGRGARPDELPAGNPSGGWHGTIPSTGTSRTFIKH